MYIYVTSSDSLETYPKNKANLFTTCFSQPLHTKHHEIGLCELSIEAKKKVSDDTDEVSDNATFIYIMLAQCETSESHGHRHQILRMVSPAEFAPSTPLIRFPDVVYIPLKEYI